MCVVVKLGLGQPGYTIQFFSSFIYPSLRTSIHFTKYGILITRNKSCEILILQFLLKAGYNIDI